MENSRRSYVYEDVKRIFGLEIFCRDYPGIFPIQREYAGAWIDLAVVLAQLKDEDTAAGLGLSGEWFSKIAWNIYCRFGVGISEHEPLWHIVEKCCNNV